MLQLEPSDGVASTRRKFHAEWADGQMTIRIDILSACFREKQVNFCPQDRPSCSRLKHPFIRYGNANPLTAIR